MFFCVKHPSLLQKKGFITLAGAQKSKFIGGHKINQSKTTDITQKQVETCSLCILEIYYDSK